MHIKSNSLLMNPARALSSWCESPPVPRIRTLSSRSKDAIARPMACPNLKQRAGEGSGCCTVLIAIGTMRTGRAFGLRPQQSQWNGEGVIDQHLLAGRHIEFVGDPRFDQMP